MSGLNDSLTSLTVYICVSMACACCVNLCWVCVEAFYVSRGDNYGELTAPLNGDVEVVNTV